MARVKASGCLVKDWDEPIEFKFYRDTFENFEDKGSSDIVLSAVFSLSVHMNEIIKYKACFCIKEIHFQSKIDFAKRKQAPCPTQLSSDDLDQI